MEKLPFKEKQINDYFIREFSSNVNLNDLKWHEDGEDRIIIPLNENNWLLQYDNELPIKLIKGKKYFIKEGVFHRVLKGDDLLKIKLYKIKNSLHESFNRKNEYNIQKYFNFHVKNNIPISENVFRVFSDAWCDLICFGREIYQNKNYLISEADRWFFENDCGVKDFYKNKEVILDTPFVINENLYGVYTKNNNKIKFIRFK